MASTMRAILAGCLLAAAFPGQVTLGVPLPFPTIQSAILAAAPGDIVLVQPGSHAGPIDFLGKAITVRSVAGALATTIDAGGAGTVASFVSGETNASVLEGFTLTNGVGIQPGAPGGLDLMGSSPVIRRCRIVGCVGAMGPGAAGTGGSGGPGGIRCALAGARLERVVVQYNLGGAGGPPTACITGLPVAIGGTGGAGGIGIVGATTSLVLDRVEVRDNLGGTGGTLSPVPGCSPTSGFVGGQGGTGGIGVDANPGDQLSLVSCLLQGNIGGEGGAAASTTSGGRGGTGGFQSLPIGAPVPFPILTFENATVVLNKGGQGNSGAAGGTGGILAPSTQFVMRSSTVAGNTAGANINGFTGTGGVLVGAGATPAVFQNSILFGNALVNAPSDLVASGSNPIATNCQIGVHTPIAGSGNSAADPLFVDPLNGDFHLSAISPCRDSGAPLSGVPNFDPDGDPRLVGPALDRGSDEYDALVGTREDLSLAVLIDGAVPGTIPVAVALAGQTVTARIDSPGGTFALSPVFLFGETWLLPNPPAAVPGFPEVRVSTTAGLLTVFLGVPMGGAAASANVPPGLAGLRFRLQAFALHGGGPNGLFAATAARDLAF